MNRKNEMNDTEKLWRFIPLKELSMPGIAPGTSVKDGAIKIWENVKTSQLVKEYVRKNLSHLWKKIRGKPNKPDRFISEKALRVPTSTMLDTIVGNPDWSGAVSAMGEMLEEWLEENGPHSRLRVVLNVPFSGASEALALLAEERKFPIIEPPTREEILNDGRDWLERVFSEEGSPLIIPKLEDCYLRHYNGLRLLRRLIDYLLSNNERCLIGCNSWAWAYLSKALSIGPLFPEPYILRPFEERHLQRWFLELTSKSDKNGVIFRHTDDGRLVLPLAGEAREPRGGMKGASRFSKSAEKPLVVSDFVEHLAAYTRGIPGVALAIWRRSLLVLGEEVGERAKEAAEDDRHRTVWVKPWSMLDLPKPPLDGDRSQLFVLHTILLHDHLPPRLLRDLLSISTIDVLETLHQLRKEELLEGSLEEEMWRIAPAGYPAIRHQLDRAGYLVDVI